MRKSARRSAPRATGSRASRGPKRRRRTSRSIAWRPDLLGGPTGRLAGGDGDPSEYITPVAIRGLPEQAHGRIPRAILAPEQPAPVRDLAQRDEGRLAERTREMRIH